MSIELKGTCPDCGKPAYGADHHYLARCWFGHKFVTLWGDVTEIPEVEVPFVTEIPGVTENVTEIPAPVTKKRGRPGKSDAKSHAERQAAYRARRKG